MKIFSKIILMIFMLILIASILFFSFYDLTGKTVGEEIYTYTKAICNKTEKGITYCEDYEVYCTGKEVANIRATGFFTHHLEPWKDPRGENGSEIIC